MADVLPDQIVARDRNQVSLAHIAQAMQDFGHAQRHRGLAGAGIAGETHMQRGRPRGQPQFLAHPVDQQQGRGFADAGLDRFQPYQFAV